LRESADKPQVAHTGKVVSFWDTTRSPKVPHWPNNW
jgi:hypothetical protein